MKASAFLPAPATLQTSVFRSETLSDEDLRSIAETISDPAGLNYHGFARVTIDHVTKTGLRVDPDDTPEHHANIVDWPAEKDAQKAKAMAIANEAELVLEVPKG